MIRTGARSSHIGQMARSVYFAVSGGYLPEVGTEVGIQKRVKKKGLRF